MDSPASSTKPQRLGAAADVAALLVRTLARHTTSADDCWFAVSEGWGALDDAFRGQPTFGLPNRNYHLASGPLAAASQSVSSWHLHQSSQPVVAG